MFSLNIQNGIVYFKDIRIDDLPKILGWYNKVDEFKFATGIDTPITIEMLTKKYAELLLDNCEIFVGIYLGSENKMIGILKGSLKDNDSVWISSIVIDHEFQNRSYGSAAITLLLNHLKVNRRIEKAYLSVVEENTQGRAFWVKNDFKYIRRIESKVKIQQKNQNVIIMLKNL